jgi:RAV-like factor
VAKAVRLFGVDLLTAPADAMARCKRARDLASPPQAAIKKQLVELALASVDQCYGAGRSFS